MSDGDALLRAIYDNPDDVTPRLVYADWLDENGQPEKAEFIRLTHQYHLNAQPPEKRKRISNKAFKAQLDRWHRINQLLGTHKVLGYADHRRGLANHWAHESGPYWVAGFLHRIGVGCCTVAPAGNLRPCVLKTGGQIRGLGLAHPLVREIWIGHSRHAPLMWVLDSATRHLPLVRKVVMVRTANYRQPLMTGGSVPLPFIPAIDTQVVVEYLARWKHLRRIETSSSLRQAIERRREQLPQKDLTFRNRLIFNRLD